MASIRKRRRVAVSGEHKDRWVVDYFDAQRVRRLKTFMARKDAEEWLRTLPSRELRLTCRRCGYEVWVAHSWLQIAAPRCVNPGCPSRGKEMQVEPA
jgi:hypothetical protein